MPGELGRAFVQIVPSAKGIKGSIEKELAGEASAAGKSAGGSLVGMIKKTIIAAGIGKALMSSLQEGGKLEQSLGGIETLFKDNADKVKAYAQEAYKTTGLSANAYMENVTSFSASLLQSLGGDTAKAADISNMAMIDMADNSNKMGTAMQDIQNAYQGFAKQNYTMLDNLKLGYGGTKKEMERLLADATKLTGVEYDIDNLADVYEAIHAIQGEIGITGTTAKEAAETLSGSFAAMKGAFKNVLGSLALGENIGPSLRGLAETVSTFLFQNLIPMVINILSSLPGAIYTLLSAALPQFIEMGSQLLSQLSSGFITGLPLFLEQLNVLMLEIQNWVVTQLPLLIQNGVDWILNLANGMLQSLPNVITSIGEILINLLSAIYDAVPTILQGGFDLITGLAKGIFDNLPAVGNAITEILGNLLQLIVDKGPDILRKGFELIGKLAKGLWDNLPEVINTIGDIITGLLNKIREYLPQILDKGWELIKEMAVGLWKALPDILAKGEEIVEALINKIEEFLTSMANIGYDLIRGLWSGISDAKGWILGKISGFVDDIVGGIKSFFGISSPSKVFAEVGMFLDQGLAKGIMDNTRPITKAMNEVEEIASRSFESDVAFNLTKAGDLERSRLSGELALQSGLTTEDRNREDQAWIIAAIAETVAATIEQYKPTLVLNHREISRMEFAR